MAAGGGTRVGSGGTGVGTWGIGLGPGGMDLSRTPTTLFKLLYENPLSKLS